jgi:hypothetical protein
MFHHPPHSLGGNIVPTYTDPVQTINRATNGKVQEVRYDYPIQDDYLIRDVLLLLESTGTQLVFYGHSHLWNRFVSPKGTNFLESSNMGNSCGLNILKKEFDLVPDAISGVCSSSPLVLRELANFTNIPVFNNIKWNVDQLFELLE